MGGFVLAAADLKNPIPLNANQLFYLVKNGYVKYPELKREDIDDRDKSDGLSR
jgi:hypothetical protein